MLRCPAMLIPLLLSGSHNVLASETDIYTIHRYPPAVQAPDIAIHYLDAAKQLENRLFPLLSPAPEVAREQSLPLLSAPNSIQQRQQLETAYGDLIDAWSLGIRKVPAVVFDRRYVIYGTTDVRAARQQLAAFQSKQQ